MKNTSPPAFPTWKRVDDVAEGMTLRDYFAAAAIQGILSDPNLTISQGKMAEWAYGIADAMMKVREQ